MPKLRTLPLLWLLLLAGLTAAGCVKVGPDFVVRTPTFETTGWRKTPTASERCPPTTASGGRHSTTPSSTTSCRRPTRRTFRCAWPAPGYSRRGRAWGSPSASSTRKSSRPSAPPPSTGRANAGRQRRSSRAESISTTGRPRWEPPPAWEIDFWGKFRRAVESADANFLGSIAAYDNALVSLDGRCGAHLRADPHPRGAAADRPGQRDRPDEKACGSPRSVSRAAPPASATCSRRSPSCAAPRPPFPSSRPPCGRPRTRSAPCSVCRRATWTASLGDRSAIPEAPLEVAVGIPRTCCAAGRTSAAPSSRPRRRARRSASPRRTSTRPSP